MSTWSINILVYARRPETLSRFNRLMAPFRLSVCDGAEHRQLLNRWLNHESFDLVVVLEPEGAQDVASILYQTRHSIRNQHVPVVALGGRIHNDHLRQLSRRGLAAAIPIVADHRKIVTALYNVWLIARRPVDAMRAKTA